MNRMAMVKRKVRRGCRAAGMKNHAVILNGVSPRAQAGAKRSEESLTETGGGGGEPRDQTPRDDRRGILDRVGREEKVNRP